MDLIEAILTRRSSTRLLEPGPDRDDLLKLLEVAATAPDHGALRPWRLVLVEGEARHRLGLALAAAAAGADSASADRARTKPLRAPLLISVIFCPRQHPKVPEWEQLATAVTLVQYLHLLLHDRGWGAIWRTGDGVDAAQVQACLDLQDDERLLGWLYVGTPDPQARFAPRPEFDVRTRLSVLDGSES
ncbi:MAG: nitroreductase [Catenulispora sp.]|nr:nitroreductase [Catenulispora sp.]